LARTVNVSAIDKENKQQSKPPLVQRTAHATNTASRLSRTSHQKNKSDSSAYDLAKGVQQKENKIVT